MADENAAIWGVTRQVWPEEAEQGGWNHVYGNVLDRLPQTAEQGEAKDVVRAVLYAPSRAEAIVEWKAKSYRPWYPKAVDRGRMAADGGVL